LLDAEAINIPTTLADTEERLSWWQYFKYKETWGLALSRFVSDGAFYFFIFWLPSYLSDVQGFALMEIGLFAWIPFLASDIGSFFGGWLGAHLISRGYSLSRSRKWIIWLGALMVVPVYLCIYIDSAMWVIALISFALFSTQIKQSSLFTLPVDIYPSKDAAYVWGITGSAGSFGAMLFTPFIGWLIDHISYNPVFMIVASLHVVSALVITIFIPKVEKIIPGKN